MNKHPVTNTGTTNMHVAGAVIRPGETRMVDLHLVPPDLQPKQAASADSTRMPDPIAFLLAKPATEVIAALSERTDEALVAIESGEQDGKARKTVLEAISAERLRRASGNQEGGQNETQGAE